MTNFINGSKNTIRFNGTKQSFGKAWIPIPVENTVIDEWYLGEFSSASYHITAEFDSNQKETMQVIVIARPNRANYTIFGRTSIQDKLITLSASVTASKITFFASPASSQFNGVKVIFTATYSETVAVITAPSSAPVITQNSLNSDTGFKSPGFFVDTSGNIDIVGSYKINGSPIIDSSGTLSSTITHSSLTSVGILSNLTVSGTTTSTNGWFTSLTAPTITALTLTSTGTLTISPSVLAINPSNTGSMNNVNIGNITPGVGNFSTLTITSTPTLSTHATTKQYVDSKTIAFSIALGS